MPGVRLNHLYLEDWCSIAEGCANQGCEDQSQSRCIAVKSSVPQGMFVCFDKEVGWCVGIVLILVVGRER
jgi:hypothetical protein